MQLRREYLVHLYYIGMSIFLCICVIGVTAAYAATGIKGRVVKSSSTTQGIAKIEVTAFTSTYDIADTDETDGNGYFEINNLDTTSFASGENSKIFYLCAKDIDTTRNQYITECYNQYYWFYSGSGGVSMGGTPITVERGQMKDINFSLTEGGNISVNLDLPSNRVGKIIIEGVIDFKNTKNFPFMREILALNDGIVKVTDTVGALPYGTYTCKLEDARLAEYYEELDEKVFDSEFLSTYYDPYRLYDFNCFLTNIYSQQIIISSANLSPGINFNSFSEGGFIYGIVTHEDAFKTPSGDVTGEKESPTLFMVGAGGIGTQELDSSLTDTNNPDSMPYFSLAVSENNIDEGIGGMQMEIIPINNQQLVFDSRIPTKMLRDPNYIYLAGKYGGYAFKFLPPGNYRLRSFREFNGIEIFSMFYGNVYNEGESSIITIGSGETKRVDFELPKVTICGKVYLNGKATTAHVRLLTPSSLEMISIRVADPNNNDSYFTFSEVISGDVIVHIAKTKGDNIVDYGYNIETIPLYDVHLKSQPINLGNIFLTAFQKPGGTGKIWGRVFDDKDSNHGLDQVMVRVVDIEYIKSEHDVGWEAVTDPNGYYLISNLPDSAFMVYTICNREVTTEGYFNEMFDDVLLLDEFYTENWCKAEINKLKEIRFDKLDLTHMSDPNILITPVILLENETKRIDFGLSNHLYPIYTGLNLFAYPGKPLQAYSTAYELIKDKLPRLIYNNYTSICDHMMTYPFSDGSVAYWDSNKPAGDNFAIEMGQGYILYSLADADAQNIKVPPFYIAPVTLDLILGRNLISMPSVFEKGYYARQVLSELGGVGASASINHYNSKAGKWETMTWLWGKSAGDNFKIERVNGYLVDMKIPRQWP